MPAPAVCCEVCGVSHVPFYMWPDGRVVCKRCFLELRGQQKMERQRKEAERLGIPDGCTFRFLFYWWLAGTNRLNEGWGRPP